MTFFIFLAAVKAVFLGAVYGRMDGGGIVKTSEWLERSLIMFFFVLACVPFAGLWALLAYAGVFGIATGHGQYFLSRMVKAIEGERLDFITRLLFGDDPRTDIKYLNYRGGGWAEVTEEVHLKIYKEMKTYGLKKLYWRNVFGMFLTGSLTGLPAAIIALYFDEYLIACLFLTTGLIKATSYIIGNISHKFFNAQDTVIAEYINGGLRSLICVFVLFLLFL